MQQCTDSSLAASFGIRFRKRGVDILRFTLVLDSRVKMATSELHFPLEGELGRPQMLNLAYKVSVEAIS